MASRGVVARGAPLVGAVTALGLGALLLERRSLTTDEAAAVDSVSGSFWESVRSGLERDPGGAVFAGILDRVAALSLDDQVVRAPSVVAFGLSVTFAYLTGARLHGRRAGLAASLALASAAPVVAAAQRVEATTLALAFALLSTWLLVRALDGEGGRSWTLYAATSCVAVLVHPAVAAALLAHGVAFVVYRRSGQRVPPVTLVPLVVGVAVLAGVGIARLEVVGDPGRGDLRSGLVDAIAWNPLLALVGVGGIVASATRRGPGGAPSKAALVGGLAVTPLLVAAAAEPLVPVHAETAGVVALGGVALAAGAGVGALRDRRLVVVLAAATAAVACVGLGRWYTSSPAENWRAAAAALRLEPRADTVVVLPNRSRAALARELTDARIVSRAGGDVVSVVLRGDERATIVAARTVVATPRYALLEERRISDQLVIQRWVRP